MYYLLLIINILNSIYKNKIIRYIYKLFRLILICSENTSMYFFSKNK